MYDLVVTLLCMLILYFAFFYKEKPVVMRKPEDPPQMFEYTRGETFAVTVVVKNGEFHCFGKQTIPEGTPENVALAFYQEAERAVTKKLVP